MKHQKNEVSGSHSVSCTAFAEDHFLVCSCDGTDEEKDCGIAYSGLGMKQVILRGSGARFSKVPVIYGPVNLPGHLSGSFIGPEVAFLEAPVNFPGTYRTYRGQPGARKNSGPLPDSCAVTSRSSAGEGERVGTLFSFESFALCDCSSGLLFCVSIGRTMQYVLSLTLGSSLFQRRTTKRSFLWIINDDHKSVAFSSSIRHVCLSPPFAIDKLQLLLSYSHADNSMDVRIGGYMFNFFQKTKG